MKIVLEAFASARERLGFSSSDFEVREGSLASDVIRELSVLHPEAALVLESSRLAVNDGYVTPETPLSAGDVLSILPPVSGGLPSAVVGPDPVDATEAAKAVASEAAGAIVTFLGTVRCANAGQCVAAIEYEAKSGMAVTELERLIAEARQRFAVDRIFIRHRTGLLKVGEISVAIAVSAAHRLPAYEANAWLLEELKRSVPIWKHEVRIVNGREERVWLGEGGG